MSNSFLPRTDAGKDLWLKNFANKLPQYVAKYSITPAELADIQQSAVSFSHWLNFKNQVDEFNQKLTTFKNEVRDGIRANATPSILPAMPALGTAPATTPGVFERVRMVAKRIKDHVNFTGADGEDLGLAAAPKTAVNLNYVKPAIYVRSVEGGIPEIVWTKNGMSGVEIEVDRNDGAGFVHLTIDSYPNYQDTFRIDRGTTAIWKYRAIYLKKDKRVGQWSDEVLFTVTGL